MPEIRSQRINGIFITDFIEVTLAVMIKGRSMGQIAKQYDG